ncbi:MAG: superoxide dismutase family protein [Oscillospiraceae bacterium]|nr:superoxide dismutase family protein [Oscillospiraceae bacterium]
MKIKNAGGVPDFAVLLMRQPYAAAILRGSAAYPDIHGSVRFYQTPNGVLIAAEVNGLPYSDEACNHKIFGFHIHEGESCDGNMHDPFSGAMSHYDPEGCTHPFHAGDMPPLFGNHGYAFSVFLTDRFSLAQVIGRTVIIHGNPDDFTAQPSGNAGEKLACGVITACGKCF